MKKLIIGVCSIILLFACSNSKDIRSAEEDLTAKSLLQGIWIDDETDMPLLRIEGDTIYYANPQNIPVAFKVIRDTIYIYGSQTVAYKIDRQTEYSFWFHSLADDIVKLHKSENVEDTLSFINQEVEVIPSAAEVTKKDSVVMYGGKRYRGYVYINPSQMKVTRTSYAEMVLVLTMSIMTMSYISVFTKANRCFMERILPKGFSNIFSAELLNQMILADMNFLGVNNKGYHYQATLRVPESSVYNLIDMFIGFDKQLNIKKRNKSALSYSCFLVGGRLPPFLLLFRKLLFPFPFLRLLFPYFLYPSLVRGLNSGASPSSSGTGIL